VDASLQRKYVRFVMRLLEFSDVAVQKPRPTSTGRCVTFKLSKLHLGCFVVFSLFPPLESLLSESS
jgi:hypothetical protein